MPTQQNCPECDREIANAALKLCPVCLLRQGMRVPDDVSISVDFDATRSYSPRNMSQGSGLVAGLQFGDHRIVRRLGSGGMGTVYEAEHLGSGRRVALKVLAHSWNDETARARFLREGRLAASINHPNSVYVFGTEEVDGVPTISMELVDGGTLQELVVKDGPMKVTDAVDALIQLINGLEEAEEKGVLHRDIKPANCFVDQQGLVKVGDYGLSISSSPNDELAKQDVTVETSFLGTPAFASPEQLRGDQLDGRSDMYSLGVTAYYLLTGKTPFTANNLLQLIASVLDTPAPNVKLLNPNVPSELASLIDKCLSKSPGNRFDSYESLRNALLPFSSSSPQAASLGVRFLAGAIDAFVPYFASAIGALLLTRVDWLDGAFSEMGEYWCIALFSIGYYAISESIWGTTAGKWLLGLRVRQGLELPSWFASLVRASIYVLCTSLLPLLILIAASLGGENAASSSPIVMFLLTSSPVWTRMLLFSTAHFENGYASIYDRLTGVRVVAGSPKQLKDIERGASSLQANTTGQQVGPYEVLREYRTSANGSPADSVLLAFDPKLLRRVWIRFQEAGATEVTKAERNLSRASRLRWLGGRRTETENWDCYEAPDGESLLSLLKTNPDWKKVEPALASLQAELAVAVEEGNLDSDLSVEQLWVTPLGTMKLLPFRSPDLEQLATAFKNEDVQDIQTKATRLLANAVARSVEACRFSPTNNNANGVPSRSLQLASQIRSSGVANSAQWLKPARRIVQLDWPHPWPIVVVALALPLLTFIHSVLTLANVSAPNPNNAWEILTIATFSGLLTWVLFIWLPSLITACLYRGGFVVRGLGYEFVNQHNKPASRFRISIRMLIQGAPLAILLAGLPQTMSFTGVQQNGWAVFVAIFLLAIVGISLYRGRLAADILAGTRLISS